MDLTPYFKARGRGRLWELYTHRECVMREQYGRCSGGLTLTDLRYTRLVIANGVVIRDNPVSWICRRHWRDLFGSTHYCPVFKETPFQKSFEDFVVRVMEVQLGA